jgi:hypothetical protein
MGLALVALAVGVVLLYYWLLGHWFARVLTFLALAVIMGMGLALLMASAANAGAANGPFGLLLGAALAWPVSGIPAYYWRWRFKQIAEAARTEDTRLTKEAMQRFNAQHGLIG